MTVRLLWEAAHHASGVRSYMPPPPAPVPEAGPDCWALSMLASSFDAGSNSGPKNVLRVGPSNHTASPSSASVATTAAQIHHMSVPFRSTHAGGYASQVQVTRGSRCPGPGGGLSSREAAA